ncbi:alanine--tRNA ligase [Patescibacteria group bacterium]|nr:alanine--tRNA ligase [Patescibacteria group bacterium]
MKANEIRQKFLDFFKAKGHQIIPSASLIPENDPSVLFTTAGMHPLVPFLMGEKHPAGKQLANCQKCLRTGDIEEVGDNSHLTFFEMLGNWSLGDPLAPDGINGRGYWKEESVDLSWEFLTDKKWLGLDPEKIAISVFAGDKDCDFDQESYHLWKSKGIDEKRIAKLGKEDNWWPAGGDSVGPQGPDTEMFYWGGKGKAPEVFDPNDKRWIEIWNDVFMQFNKKADGTLENLKQKNVDTGFGLERATAILQGKESVYQTELFSSLIDFVKSMSRNYEETSARIIVDHCRAAIFILADEIGIIPSNLDQGYVVRKLIRRAIRHARKIDLPLGVDLTTPLVKIVVEQFKDIYPEVLKNKQRIIDELNKEEDCFEKTLEKGLKEFKRLSLDKEISGKESFDLYATYGFPLEMTKELAKEQGVVVDEQGFLKEFKKHQELSRTASAGMFKGGLADDSEIVTKYHTVTHLLHQALRDVLGDQVGQKGSNITAERLRFDFSHSQKLTEAELKKVEEIVNQKIKENLPITFKEASIEEAKKSGAIGLFSEKYGKKVKVYSIGDPSAASTSSGSPFSREICGGPHVTHTGELGHFKIIKEEASSAGVRRIKAILE